MKINALSRPAVYILSAVFLSSIWLFCAPLTVFSQVSHSSTVTALVPDNIPPSTPILISPTNGSTINTATPTFVWQASTDNVAMDSYTLTVDGNILFADIPLTSISNSQYVLTYNSSDSTYSLTPVDPLTNGTHTWKITAFDTSDNSTDSVTWTFTIDTQAPTFVITQIGNQSVSISSQDVSTIPTSPIMLPDNEPLIAGTGEVGAEVVMTVTIPGEPTQTYTFTIDSGGTWSVQLGVLPRGVTMYLSFTITDAAGNVSVLQNVPFQIEAIVIVFPPVASPVSSPGSTGIASPVPSPIIAITVTPPRETVIRIVDRIAQQLPPIIRNIIEALPEELRAAISEPIRIVAPISALVATAALPTLSLLNLLLEFGGQLSWQLLVKILQALGLLPPSEPQGLVFDSDSYEPVSYALLTIRSTHPDLAEQILETAISDENGVYQGIELPSGDYFLSVDHQDYHFPTRLPRPSYLSLKEFYRGEPFVINAQSSEPLFLIPVDSINKDGRKKTWRDRLRLFTARFKLRNLVVPLFIFSCVVTLFYPSTLNFIILGLYVLVFMRRALIRWRTPMIAGVITDNHGSVIQNAIIRVSDEQIGQTRVLLRSDQNGRFATRIGAGTYQLSVSKLGYVWVENDAIVPFMEATAMRNAPALKITLKQISEIIVP